MFRKGSLLTKTRWAITEINADTLHVLAQSYKRYLVRHWRYSVDFEGVDDFLVRCCIKDAEALKTQIIVIGEGLLAGNVDAIQAARLFDHLYKYGFADGLYKMELQKQFESILSADIIEGLNNGSVGMVDAMISFCEVAPRFGMK